MDVEFRESGHSLPGRVRLPRPMLAAVDGAGALLLDVGPEGALLEHYGKARAGDRFALTLPWRLTEMRIECDVVHSRVSRVAACRTAVSLSAVRFRDEPAELGAMLEELTGRLAQAQVENANATSGDAGAFLGRLGDAFRMRTQGFTRFRYVDGDWTESATDAPMQPPDGFTVAGSEEEEEIRLLCSAYEAADADGRDLIRRMARASIRRDQRSRDVRDRRVLRMLAS